MNTLLRLLTVFAVPLMWLNALGGIVAGIWLAILGEWGMIGWGFGFMFFSVWGLSLAMMPGFIFALPIGYLYERGHKVLASPFILLGILYTGAVITIWCGWTLAFFAQRADDSSLIPALMWAYGAATGPLSYMAQQEGQGGGDNAAAAVTTYFAQVGFVVMVLTALFAGVTIDEAMIVFAGMMAVGTIFQFVSALQQDRERKAVAEGVA